MPYITQEKREMLKAGSPTQNVGELNYAITKVIVDYIKLQGLKYQTINDVLGALEGAKLEFYARVARPYENGKIAENGDVYYVS
jgi:hypothetical protein